MVRLRCRIGLLSHAHRGNPHLHPRADLAHFGTVGGIELAKVHRRIGVRVDLGHFGTVGGIELAKIAEAGRARAGSSVEFG